MRNLPQLENLSPCAVIMMLAWDVGMFSGTDVVKM